MRENGPAAIARGSGAGGRKTLSLGIGNLANCVNLNPEHYMWSRDATGGSIQLPTMIKPHRLRKVPAAAVGQPPHAVFGQGSAARGEPTSRTKRAWRRQIGNAAVFRVMSPAGTIRLSAG